MTAVRLGRFGDRSTLEIMQRWLEHSAGLSPMLARMEVTVGCDPFQDAMVHLVEGLPFIEHEDCLIPLASNRYRLYRNRYLPVIKMMGGSEVPGLFYPVPFQAPTFDSQLKAMPFDYRSHMVGTKSRRVEWRTLNGNGIGYRETISAITSPLASLYLEHVEDVSARYGLPVNAIQSIDAWNRFADIPDDRMLSYAVDHLRDGKVIAAMQVFRTQNSDGTPHLDCVALSFPKDPEYRPYSITACCHINMVRWLYEQGGGTINYGLNPPGGVGDYKRNFAAAEPVLGLTTASL